MTEPAISALTPTEKGVPRAKVWAWALWDWASSGFVAVVTTFVFSVYLTSEAFGKEDALAGQVAFAAAIAGFAIAVLAPLLGSRSDNTGHRKRWLFITTAILVVITTSLFFIEPAPEYFLPGLLLFTVASVIFELAQVNYNAMLTQVSTPKTVGRVSGFGWALGYFGSIALLLLLLVAFIQPEVGLFGVTSEQALNIRASMLATAAWFALFALPIFVKVPEVKPLKQAGSRSIWAGYPELWQSIKRLWHENRSAVWFLLASAVYRDGLSGAFTLGGIIAARSFGLGFTSILLFAIVGNLIAGVITVISGRLDDLFGAKPVIIFSLALATLAGLAMFFFQELGQSVFWAAGLTIAAFVGPIQAASRSLLLRLAPEASPGTLFGLYATTGRITSFLSQLLFGIAVAATGATIFGVFGIAIVLFAGLLLLIPVKVHRAKGQVV